MTDSPRWVLVADAARCRVFATDPGLHQLTIARELRYRGARLPNHDLFSDAMGNRRENNGAAHPASGDERHWESRKKLYQAFAREIRELLRRGLDDGAYGELVLVCAPEFLGILRPELDARVAARVVAEVAKDLSKLPLHELHEALRHDLTPAGAGGG